MSKAHKLLVELGCMATGIIVGYFLGRQIAEELGPPLQLNVPWLLGISVFAVTLGFAGLWIGFRLAPPSGYAVYPLAFVLVLSYFVWQFSAFQGPDFVKGVPLFLRVLHPITVVAIIGSWSAVMTGWQWPPLRVLVTWALVPLLLNSVLWSFGLPLLGWRSDLASGGLILIILPINGILFGLGSAPVLWRWLAKYSMRKATYVGMGFQLCLLVINLFIASQFGGGILGAYHPVRFPSHWSW